MSHLGTFDLIFSFSVVQFFDGQSVEILARQLEGLLTPEGSLVHMSIPDANHYFRSAVPDSLSFPSPHPKSRTLRIFWVSRNCANLLE